MKNNFIKKTSGITFSDSLFAIVLICLIYLSWQYIPLVYNSEELESIAKDYTFKSGAATEENIRLAVIEDAKRKVHITLAPDDVIIIKDRDRTKIQITWHTAIELPFDYQIPKTFNVEYERKNLY